MNKFGIISRTVACGLALAAVALASSAQADSGRAQVVGVKGAASYSDGTGGWNTLTLGKSVMAGSKIRTDAASEADLTLDQGGYGSTLSAKENTTVGLTKLDFNKVGNDNVTETSLDLSAGRITGFVKKLSTGSKYEITTPNGIFGVVGKSDTRFDISASGTVRIIEGDGVFVYTAPGAAAVTLQIPTGSQFVPGPTPGVTVIPATEIGTIVGQTPGGVTPPSSPNPPITGPPVPPPTLTQLPPPQTTSGQ